MCDDAIRQDAQRNPEEDMFKQQQQQPCKDIKIGLIKTLYMQASKCVAKMKSEIPGDQERGAEWLFWRASVCVEAYMCDAFRTSARKHGRKARHEKDTNNEEEKFKKNVQENVW